jgi:multidrug efflux pump subunit AcrA (membrane-fusion protein)
VDKVRVFLDVPAMEANGVEKGSPAIVRVQAVEDEEISAKVARTSWSLSLHTRTLRAEVDLPNPDRRLLPGMYAYGWVRVTRSNVWSMPMTSTTTIGNQDCCYLYEDGRAVLTPLWLGINNGKWVEVTRKRENGKWVPFTGKEEVIAGDLSELSDGQRVRVARAQQEK